MIKVVLDTNVLVSAHLTRNSKAEMILSLAAEGIVEIYLSPQILMELESTLLSPKLMRIHKDTAKQVRRSVMLLREFVKMTPGCKFHSTSNTNSEKGRTPIPVISEHPFRFYSNTFHVLSECLFG